MRSGETAEPLGETRQIDKAIGPLRHTGPSAFLLATFSFFLSCWGDTPRGGTPSPRLPPAESGTASALPGTSAAGGASPRSVTTGGRDPAARLPLRSRCPPISSPKGPQGGQPPVVWVRAGGPERCCEAGGLSSSQERACEPGGGRAQLGGDQARRPQGQQQSQPPTPGAHRAGLSFFSPVSQIWKPRLRPGMCPSATTTGAAGPPTPPAFPMALVETDSRPRSRLPGLEDKGAGATRISDRTGPGLCKLELFASNSPGRKLGGFVEGVLQE